ncbi:protocadherin gamma-A4-like [Hippoglossus hippoglossus]|uniref:protocadherin gamma-A4-like n=1 Tax=Hippoglossus hippoglossus TaxID=8267 RepID=UPI00148B892F|nr:protocadherin gamma-A4-like [Hippoglossus hippoglossus]
MNDNHPEISIKSFQSPVNENIELDTVIAVVSVSDKDSGDNGVVDLRIPDNMPFKLRESSDNYYELVVSEPLDREKVPEYDVTFTVTDRGSPPLSDNETMTLELLDINDNVPQFPQSFYTIRVMKNNAPGALLSSLTAFDPDLHENQYLVYFILEKEIANTSMSMLFSINPENGNLYALKTFDYEIEKEFLFHIEARDSGSPPLSSNVTVHIVIVDQNDNVPVIVSPWRAHGSVVEEKIPRSTDKGSLVAKVIGLGSVSFLLLITILVTIVLKCQKPKPSNAAPPCRNSVISERNSTIADSTLVSNDAYWYSLFLAETRKGKMVVRQPVPKGSRYIVSSIPRGTGLTDTSDSAASTLQRRR